MAQTRTSILDDVHAALSGGAVKDISSRLGADPARTRTAIDDAIPILVAALGKEAADPARRSGLEQAIREDHDGSVVDDLSTYLSGGMTSRATNGDKIVDHVLGDRREPAVQALSGRSGLDMSTIASLLPLLAPIVMGILGRKQRSGDVNFDSITDVLGRDTQRAADGSPDLGDLLGSVLGGGADGQQGGLGDLLGSILGGR
jgi:hypothetical protein